MKSISKQLGYILTFLGIGGALDQLDSWKEITRNFKEYIGDTAIGQILIDFFTSIFDIYADILDILFFFLPDHFWYRELLAIVLIIFGPQLRRLRLGSRTTEELNAECEKRFVLYCFFALIAVAFQEKEFGQSGLSLNIMLPIYMPATIYVIATLIWRAWVDSVREMHNWKFYGFLVMVSLAVSIIPANREREASAPSDDEFWVMITIAILTLIAFILNDRRRKYLLALEPGQKAEITGKERFFRRFFNRLFTIGYLLFAAALILFLLWQFVLYLIGLF